MIKVKFKGNFLKEVNAAIAAKRSKILDGAVSALKEATPVDTGYARDSWKHDGKAITNDAEYIEKLNSGSSKQAPSFFIERTLLAQQGILPGGTIVRSK